MENQSERNEKDGFVYFGYIPFNLTTFDGNKNSLSKGIIGNNMFVDQMKSLKECAKNDYENLKVDFNLFSGNNINNTNFDESSM